MFNAPRRAAKSNPTHTHHHNDTMHRGRRQQPWDRPPLLRRTRVAEAVGPPWRRCGSCTPKSRYVRGRKRRAISNASHIPHVMPPRSHQSTNQSTFINQPTMHSTKRHNDAHKDRLLPRVREELAAFEALTLDCIDRLEAEVCAYGRACACVRIRVLMLPPHPPRQHPTTPHTSTPPSPHTKPTTNNIGGGQAAPRPGAAGAHSEEEAPHHQGGRHHFQPLHHRRRYCCRRRRGDGAGAGAGRAAAGALPAVRFACLGVL